MILSSAKNSMTSLALTVLLLHLLQTNSFFANPLHRSFSPTKTTTTTTTTTSILSATETPITTDKTLPNFDSRESYLSYLKSASTLPRGFQVASGVTKFIPPEAPLMGPLPIRCTIVYLPAGPTTTWSGTFTSNRFPGAPIIVGRDRLSSSPHQHRSALQALVINNKVSNVCSPTGVDDANFVCDAVASSLSLPGGASSVLPSSTGVIGWKLPSEELSLLVPSVVLSLQSETAMPLAEGIMTTDRYPKLRSVMLKGGARIVGVAKGAGMIEPNMATMLCYILTDAILPKEDDLDLDDTLRTIVNDSFNAVSIDGDESTSDTCVLMSSEMVELEDVEEFKKELEVLCKGLAADLVRNGEGTSHVMRVTLENWAAGQISRKQVIKLGRHIVNSPLFKCAVAGNDPNIGRLAAAIGSFLGKLEADHNAAGTKTKMMVDTSKMVFTIGGQVIFQNGVFQIEGDDTEKLLSNHMKEAQFYEEEQFPSHQKFVEIGIDFGENTAENVVVLGSDLTQEYVKINADYRS